MLDSDCCVECVDLTTGCGADDSLEIIQISYFSYIIIFYYVYG